MSGPGTRTGFAALSTGMNDVLTFESRRKPRRLGRGKPVVGGRKVSVVAVSVGLL